MILREACKEDHSNLLHFGKKYFGKGASPASAKFYTWFLKENPQNKTLIVTDEKNQIASMLNILMIATPDSTKINVLFNYQTANDKKGAGFYLLQKVRKLKNFIVPGVIGPLASTYTALKASSHPLFWGRKFLMPKLSFRCPPLFKTGEPKLEYIRVETNKFLVTNQLDHNLFLLLEGTILKDHVHFLKWRLRSIDEKRCFVAINKLDRSVLLSSVGKRRHIPVLRTFLASGNDDSLIPMLHELERIGKDLGVLVFLIATAEKYKSLLIRKLDFRALPDQPKTMIKGKIPKEIMDYLGIYSDIGFTEQWGCKSAYGFATRS